MLRDIEPYRHSMFTEAVSFVACIWMNFVENEILTMFSDHIYHDMK